jgi:hypothetical protein
MPVNFRATSLLALAWAAAIGVGFAWPKDPPPNLALEMQHEHASGVCGSMAPGTGLTWMDKHEVRGWVASMMLGKHELRVRGTGAVEPQVVDFEPTSNRYVSLKLTGVEKDSVLEWKIPGARNWEKVPTAFLYKVDHPERVKLFEYLLEHDLPYPGFKELRPSQLKDPTRIVPPGRTTTDDLRKHSDELWEKWRKQHGHDDGEL